MTFSRNSDEKRCALFNLHKFYLIGFLGAAFILPSIAWAQNLAVHQSPDAIWSTIEPNAATALRSGALDGRQAIPDSHALVLLNTDVLKAVLTEAPGVAARTDNTERSFSAPRPKIALPKPDGSYEQFEIEETQLLSRQLAEKNADLRTYQGRSLRDQNSTLVMQVFPREIFGQFGPINETTVIRPALIPDAPNVYEVFQARHERGGTDEQGHPTRQCTAPGEGAPQDMQRTPLLSPPVRYGGGLRTYRLVIAATSKYAEYHGENKNPNCASRPTQEEKRNCMEKAAFRAIVTTVDAVRRVYQRDLSISFELTDVLIFSDPAHSPFQHEDVNNYLHESQAAIETKLKDTDFDLGHTFCYGNGGKGEFASAGISGKKAKGATCLKNPIGDVFDIDFVAHEIGHQFNARHTFNGKKGSCSSSARSPATAYEPGSGSTIMGYANTCGDDNVATKSDDYFHFSSLDAISLHASTAPGQPRPTETGNALPSITIDGGGASKEFYIPIGVPFRLSVKGHDPDSEDKLTYAWEQEDLGNQRSLQELDDGTGPLFRSTLAATGERPFPKLTDLLNGNSPLAERIPTRPRAMHFRAVVRDNYFAGGGYATDRATVHVVEDTSFKITSPRNGEWFRDKITVKWEKKNTDKFPFNTKQVNIRASLDGETDFPILLSSGAPNNGEREIMLPPSLEGHRVRIKVEPVGGVYYAISPEVLVMPRQASN